MAINRTPSAAPTVTQSAVTQPSNTAAVATPGAAYKLPSGKVGTFICAVAVGGETKYAFAVPDGKPEHLQGTDAIEASSAPPPPAILPPDAPVSAPPPAKRQLLIEDVPEAAEVTDAGVPAHVVEAPVVEAPVVEAPKRGRPVGAKNKPRDPSPEAPVVVESPPPIAAAPAGVHLYFGCSPVGVVTQTLHAYVDDLELEIIKVANQHGASPLKAGDDLRTAEDKVFGFGKWKAYIKAAAKERTPSAGHYVVAQGADERVDCAADALAAVLPPGSVVRGGR